MSSSVIIVGGGISGTAAAWELARHGIDVTLIERGDLASMASGWTLAGVRQSGRHPAELPLAQAAVRRWETLADELEADVEYRQGGNLRLALTADDVPLMRQVVADGIAVGIEMRYLDSIDEIHELSPALTGDLHGASFCPTDGHANPQRAVAAFAHAAQRAGATILTGTSVDALIVEHGRVVGVQTSAGRIEGDRVIVAAGVYTPTLLDPLGIHIPFDIVHVPAVQTVPTAPILDQVLGIPAGGFAGRQQADGRFRLTGGSLPWAESWHDDDNVRPTVSQVQDTIAWATRLVPAIRDLRIAQVWGGLIDKTPDVLPVIEITPEVEGLIVAAGFSGHGFCLGPITGEILADLAVEGVTSHPIAPFAQARLDHVVTTEAAALHG